jgi:site-specific recombinase XerD
MFFLRSPKSVKEKWELVSSHTARRTFITLALERGVTYKQVMKQTGIVKVETLLKYDHANRGSIGKAIQKVFP